MLVVLGWWPPNIPFTTGDLRTVAAVLEEQNRHRGRR